MSSISHAQFARQGGGSRRFSDRTPGPSTGYFVSRDPDVAPDQGGSQEVVARRNSVAVTRRHFQVNQGRALAAQAPAGSSDVFQGVWTSSPSDESDGHPRTYLDISDHYPDVMDAGMAAIKNKQKGMYGAEADTTIPVWNEDRSKYSVAGINDEVKRIIRSR